MRKVLALFFWIALGGWIHGQQTPAGNYATMTVNVAAPGYTIPSTFLGSGGGKAAGGLGSGYFAPGSGLIPFLQKLGASGGYRVGGTECASSESSPVALATIQNLYSYLSAIGSGWTKGVIWCFNMAYPTMGGNDITYAEAELGYLESTFGSGVVTYAIGNEPDAYYGSEAAYQSQWSTFYAALHTAYPAARFEGPELANSQTAGAGWLASFTAGVAGSLAFASEHYYGPSTPTTPAQLMLGLENSLGTTPNSNRAKQDPVIASPLLMQMDEIGTNDSGGGTSGLDNAAISATWMVESVITLAKNNWRGVNVGLTCNLANYYVPINGTVCGTTPSWYVNPVFAGMLLSSNVLGANVAPVSGGSYGASVDALGLVTPAGNAALLIANLDTVNAVSIVPQSSAAWSSASATVVSGDNSGGACGPTGAASLCVDINGVLMSSATGACVSSCPPTTFAKGGWVTIPAGGAALITLN